MVLGQLPERYELNERGCGQIHQIKQMEVVVEGTTVEILLFF